MMKDVTHYTKFKKLVLKIFIENESIEILLEKNP